MLNRVIVVIPEASGDATYDRIVLGPIDMDREHAAELCGRVIDVVKEQYPDEYEWSDIEMALETAGFLAPCTIICPRNW